MQKLIGIIAATLLLGACSSIDCPLNRTVLTKFRLAGEVTRLTDTLTLSVARGDGNDTVLLNKALPTDSFTLPLSYSYDSDIFYIEVHPEGLEATIDTLTITKSNEPHFEAIDCPPSVFHTISAVTTTHHRIDSVVINHPKVSYDSSTPHLLIYFKTSIH